MKVRDFDCYQVGFSVKYLLEEDVLDGNFDSGLCRYDCLDYDVSMISVYYDEIHVVIVNPDRETG